MSHHQTKPQSSPALTTASGAPVADNQNSVTAGSRGPVLMQDFWLIEKMARFEPPLKISGAADRYNHRDGNDDYTQPGNLFRLMTPDAQQRLFGNIARRIAQVPRKIQLRAICHFFRADPAYGTGVAKALGLDLEKEMSALNWPRD